MNDKIKEINIKIPGQILDYVDTKEHLLDLFNYITNLQKTNKNHSKKLIELGNKINNLQQENEIRQQDINNLTYQLAKMKEENERLKEEKDNLYLDNAMLKMEKDIYKTGYEELKDLLSSLQNGSDNDGK